MTHLTLAWMAHVTPGSARGGRGFGRAPVIVGGEGPGDINVGGGTIKASALEVDGILYFTMPDNAWAVDARDGSELWHYFWKTKGGTHIGNRGLGMWHNYPIHGDAGRLSGVPGCEDSGKERWHKDNRRFGAGIFLHARTGGRRESCAGGHRQRYRRAGVAAILRSRNRAICNGSSYTVPMKKGDPGLDTWGSVDAARHGGGQAWVPGVYDPETNLYIFSTGNPTPAFTTGTRGTGDNLFTCAIVALNVDTGKMAWYYSTSPHDMHDYDSAQTPVLVDAMFNGKMRKLVLTAARNGYYFTFDRVTGEHLVTTKYGLYDELGQRPEPEGRPHTTIRKRMPRSRARWYRPLPTAPLTGSRLLTLPILAYCMSRSITIIRSSISPTSIRADRWVSAGRKKPRSDRAEAF